MLIQHRPATATDHQAILPNYVPDGEILGRVSKLALLEVVRSLGLLIPAPSAAGEEIHILDRALYPEFDHVREDFVVLTTFPRCGIATPPGTS